MTGPIHERARTGGRTARVLPEIDDPIEQWRTRVGLLCLVAGIALLLIAWVSWAYRVGSGNEPGALAPETTPAPGEMYERPPDTSLTAQWVLVGSLLILAFIGIAYALARAVFRSRTRTGARLGNAEPRGSENSRRSDVFWESEKELK